jgi:hypothetical protein
MEMVSGKSSDLMLMHIRPDGTPGSSGPWLTTAFNEVDPVFSPEANPRWVAYTSDESGRAEIYLDSSFGSRRKVRSVD